MKIKKIIFIRPGVRFPSQPLGLLYLISVLRQNFPDQFEMKLIEQRLYSLSWDETRKQIKEFNPDLVGFSCMSTEANEMAAISKIIKELNPKCLTILGGPHASVFYDRTLEKADIDIVVIGEGERIFIELIEKLKNDDPIDNVKGIAFKKDGKIILTPPREPIEDLDIIPFPAWDLVDFGRYKKWPIMNTFARFSPSAILLTSRGCPFQCVYCHNIFGKRTRFRSPENVVEEIELLTKKYGVKEIRIIDDIFNLDLNRAKRICDLIIEKKIKIKISFPNGLRGDMMDRELIQKLKKAGCYSITYAVDTASPRLQKIIKRDIDLEKVRQAIEWTNQKKIITRGFFMLGFPGETLEEMEATIKFALDCGILSSFFPTVVVFPRTPLMEIAKKVYPDFNFDFDKWDLSDFHYRSPLPFYAKVTGVNIFKIQCRAYQRFYIRPKIIFSLLRCLPKNISLFWAAVIIGRLMFPKKRNYED